MKIAIGIGTCLRSLLIAAFFLTGSTANAGTHLSHSVIGFSADGRFLAQGRRSRKQSPSSLWSLSAVENLGLGADPGEQLYKSGTSTRTTFRIKDLGDFELRLQAKPATVGKDEAVDVVLTGAGKSKVIYYAKGGYAYSINSILMARGRNAFVVILKQSRMDDAGEHREYKLAFVPLG